jgi:two-component system KDP operon response regulator KdpE
LSNRILVVEDDEALMTVLNAALDYGGYEAVGASTGADAMSLFKQEAFGGVLLDIGLPDVQGGTLLREMRRLSDLPIIVVSGHDSERDKVTMLDLGADDFVAKPFLPGELLARLRAAKRRAVPVQQARVASEPSYVRLGRLELDPLLSVVALDGQKIDLTPAEYAILQALMLCRHKPLSQEDLMRELYGTEERPQSAVVKVYMARLRSKLREVGAEGDRILNRRGQGWVLLDPDEE